MHISKLLLISVIGTVLVGCSEYPNIDEFPDFEKYKALAINGQSVDCEKIESTIITKIHKHMFMPVGEEYYQGIIDFVGHDGYSFEMCQNIGEKIEKYCSKSMGSILYSYRRTGVLSTYNNNLCGHLLTESVNQLNDEYTLPNTNSMFFEIERLGLLIDPSIILSMKYGKKSPILWYLNISSQDETYSLFFGNEEKFKIAKKEITELVTTVKRKSNI